MAFYEFTQYGAERVEQIQRIIAYIDRAEDKAIERFREKNPYVQIFGEIDNYNFIPNSRKILRHVLSDRLHELGQERVFLDRGLNRTSDLKTYNRLVCLVARKLKVPRKSLRKKRLSELQSLAS